MATIKIKRSSVSQNVPTNSQLETGELAINTADGKLYSANSTAVFEIGANLSSLTVNAMAFPTADGANGKVITTYGNGTLYWGEGGATATGAFTEYEFTAATNQTNFAGNDNNGSSLSYRTADSIKVFLNGILLENGTDYTATNSSNVVLTGAASNNDIIQIHSYNLFSSNNVTVAANNNVGIGNTSPAHLFSVNGKTFFGANVQVGATLLDNQNRALKVYYANGDLAWG